MDILKIGKGNDKEQVVILQRLLQRCGYALLVDGAFGAKTAKVVKTFQKKGGLVVDGIVGKEVWNALFSDPLIVGLEIIGIDVSHYESNVDWQGLFNDVNHCYAFGFAKGTSGAVGKDPSFGMHWANMKSSHFVRGVYHFMDMLNFDIESQVQNFLSLGIDFKERGVLAPVLDIEQSHAGDDAAIILNKDRIVVNILTWLTEVERATGIQPIIYVNRNTWDNLLLSPKGFEGYLLWVASYVDAPSPVMPSGWVNWTLWQYAANDGNPGGYDLNRLDGEYFDLLFLAGY